MSNAWVLAKKEFRGYFSSWQAYVFVFLFVVASMITFFMTEQFFGSSRAEMRGFFKWVPILLVFLVPGLTMRQWAREREMGSIELLMTLPARTHELVLGKFFGVVGLVAIALAFTLSIPITVENLGDLDWGPVIGGYCAALLVGAAYAAIGLFVSAWFSDQFMALLAALTMCGLFAGLSAPNVLDYVKDVEWLGATLAFLGSWSRFQAIERGVLDLRDIAYYLSVVGLFLFLNVGWLRLRRWA